MTGVQTCALPISFAWGDSPENAVYHAVVMEKAAEMNLKTLMLNPDACLAPYILDKHYRRKHGEDAYYGQEIARKQQLLVVGEQEKFDLQ